MSTSRPIAAVPDPPDRPPLPDMPRARAQEVDDVDDALRQVRELIETVVTRHQVRTLDQSLLVTTEDTDTAVRALDRLVANAERSVSVLVPANSTAVKVLTRVLENLAGRWAGSVRVRLICSPEVAMAHRLAEFEHAGGGARTVQVRLAGESQRGLVIIDDRVALVRSDPEAGDNQASLVRAPVVVKALQDMFMSNWQRAIPLTEYEQISAYLRGGSGAQILRFLYEGYTDEAAARELSISVRTYRRRVAEIMRALGATSRFQAGVYTLKMGLL
ncbi:LuxR family transcriptional regulator [Streptomyces sp. NPDC057702]|uniref:LuxR family transcriptional regulator n=1 Tax=unclassified Streptomyces TaxID=2593676 RepID=UPI00367DB1B6